MSELVIAFLKIEGEVICYDKGSYTKNPDVRWLVKELIVKADKELGIEKVDVEVRASENGVLYDILLNGGSIGYFATKAFAGVLEEMKMAELVTYGPSTEVDTPALLEEHDHKLYVIPLLGDC